MNRKPGITAGELAGIMQLQHSTVTRLVDKLESEGYLSRRTEGRFMQVYPTARATRADGPLEAAWRRLYRRYVDILGEQQSRRLTAAISEAGEKLERE